MRPISFKRRSIVLAPLGLAASLLGVSPAGAQTQGDGFLFRTPVGSFAIRAGFSQASAGSDIYSFVTDELTLGRSDFSGISYGADLAFTLLPHLDLVLGGTYSGSSAESEFRRFVDNIDRPIEQTTSI